MQKVYVISGSSRDNGNSELLMQKAVENIPHKIIKLREYQIQPIKDVRHNGVFENQQDDYYQIIEEMLSYQHILFVTPIYWYNVSGMMKDFIDRWTESLRSTQYNFKEAMKDKTFYLIVVGANPDKSKANPIIEQFKYLTQYFSIPFGGAVIGSADKPGEIVKDVEAVDKAQRLFIK